jgi:hypothetical protein
MLTPLCMIADSPASNPHPPAQDLLDAFQHAVNGALGTADLGDDFRDRVTLQPQ